MKENHHAEVRSLRTAAPELYQKMIEVFAKYHIHPYDAQGTVIKKETGLDVTLQFSNAFSRSVTSSFSFEQAKKPDEEVIRFFEESAEQCKTQLITDYFKMIKV